METQEQQLTFKSLFLPLTNVKSIMFILIIESVVFFNCLFNQFAFDDNDFIIRNPEMRRFDLLFSFGPNLFNKMGQYRPLPEAYFSFLYQILGNNPFPYHVLQLVFHFTCVVLIYLIFRKFFNTSFALLFSTIFLVHPINVESVSFIAQTVNPLLLLFGLITLFIVINLKQVNRFLALIPVFLLMGLFTKETAILFAFLILLYSFLYSRKNLPNLLIASAIVIPIYLFFRIFIAHVGLETRPLAPIANLPFVQRLITVPAVIFYYIKTCFFPLALAVDQHWVVTNVRSANFWAPLILDIVFFTSLFLMGVYIYKHHKKFTKPYVFFSAWFIFGFLMHIQLFPLDQTVADRWMYLPLVGLLGTFGIFCQTINNRFLKKGLIIVLIVVIALLSVRTIIRNTDWKNELNLFKHDAQVSDNYDVENELGGDYLSLKDYSNAILHYKKSIALRPYEGNIYNLGAVYENEGNFAKAESYYSIALNAETYGVTSPHKHILQTYVRYLYVILFFNPNDSKLNYVLQLALADYPDSADLWQIMALSKYKIHDRQGALSAAYKAYQLSPDERSSLIFKQIQEKSSFKIIIDSRELQF